MGIIMVVGTEHVVFRLRHHAIIVLIDTEALVQVNNDRAIVSGDFLHHLVERLHGHEGFVDAVQCAGRERRNGKAVDLCIRIGHRDLMHQNAVSLGNGGRFCILVPGGSLLDQLIKVNIRNGTVGIAILLVLVQACFAGTDVQRDDVGRLTVTTEIVGTALVHEQIFQVLLPGSIRRIGSPEQTGRVAGVAHQDVHAQFRCGLMPPRIGHEHFRVKEIAADGAVIRLAVPVCVCLIRDGILVAPAVIGGDAVAHDGNLQAFKRLGCRFFSTRSAQADAFCHRHKQIDHQTQDHHHRHDNPQRLPVPPTVDPVIPFH